MADLHSSGKTENFTQFVSNFMNDMKFYEKHKFIYLVQAR